MYMMQQVYIKSTGNIVYVCYYINANDILASHKNLSSRFTTGSDTNWLVRLHGLAEDIETTGFTIILGANNNSSDQPT